MPRAQPGFLLGEVKRSRLFSSRAESEMVAALSALDAAAVERGTQHQSLRQLAEALAGLLYLGSDDSQAAHHLAGAVTKPWARGESWGQGFLGRHFASVDFQLGLIYERLGVEVLFRESLDLSARTLRLALSLALEGIGDLPRAVEVARGVEPEFLNRDVVRLVLADQLAQLGDFQAIVDLTDGVVNKYNYGAFLCAYRGMALRELDMHGAAFEAFREALKSEQRLPAIRFSVWSERSRTHQAAGNLIAARRDLKLILAENDSLPGIRQRLEALGG